MNNFSISWCHWYVFASLLRISVFHLLKIIFTAIDLFLFFFLESSSLRRLVCFCQMSVSSTFRRIRVTDVGSDTIYRMTSCRCGCRQVTNNPLTSQRRVVKRTKKIVVGSNTLYPTLQYKCWEFKNALWQFHYHIIIIINNMGFYYQLTLHSCVFILGNFIFTSVGIIPIKFCSPLDLFLTTFFSKLFPILISNLGPTAFDWKSIWRFTRRIIIP